jgi:hypothetical protein
MPKKRIGDRPELNPVNVGAAAIDIGSKMHMAAVNPACTDMPVRAFGTFTQDLHDLADWFKACGVTSVACMFRLDGLDASRQKSMVIQLNQFSCQIARPRRSAGAIDEAAADSKIYAQMSSFFLRFIDVRVDPKFVNS